MTDDLWPAPAPEPNPMSRADRVHEVLRLEALAAAAAAAAAEHRTVIETEARQELTAQGAAPTWRFKDVGTTVTLPTSTLGAVVSDPAALVAWCKERHPTEVEQVEQIRGAFQSVLLKRLILDGGVAVDPDTGEVVPGLTVRPAGLPKAISFRVDAEAKALYAKHGAQVLAELGAAQ